MAAYHSTPFAPGRNQPGRRGKVFVLVSLFGQTSAGWLNNWSRVAHDDNEVAGRSSCLGRRMAQPLRFLLQAERAADLDGDADVGQVDGEVGDLETTRQRSVPSRIWRYSAWRSRTGVLPVQERTSNCAMSANWSGDLMAHLVGGMPGNGAARRESSSMRPAGTAPGCRGHRTERRSGAMSAGFHAVRRRNQLPLQVLPWHVYFLGPISAKT